MGQMTFGVLFGVGVPDGVTMRDDEVPAASGGLLDRWQLHCKPEVEALMKREGINVWKAEDRFLPDWTGGEMLGFWIACGASGMDDVPDLPEAIALDDLATTEPYAASVATASARWQAFASWCAAQGVDLPPARLWLAQTEVA